MHDEPVSKEAAHHNGSLDILGREQQVCSCLNAAHGVFYSRIAELPEQSQVTTPKGLGSYCRCRGKKSNTVALSSVFESMKLTSCKLCGAEE
jgi:hypothetical protein